VSALLRQLVECGKVKRTEDKRKAYFSKVWAKGGNRPPKFPLDNRPKMCYNG
jgi:hypothetical protein